MKLSVSPLTILAAGIVVAILMAALAMTGTPIPTSLSAAELALFGAALGTAPTSGSSTAAELTSMVNSLVSTIGGLTKTQAPATAATTAAVAASPATSAAPATTAAPVAQSAAAPATAPVAVTSVP
ncbi:MAG: hypothetical protein M0Z87_03025 [Actinomycetota bacterium]|nr:hypothetical protein [Actinomycetota bacterium]